MSRFDEMQKSAGDTEAPTVVKSTGMEEPGDTSLAGKAATFVHKAAEAVPGAEFLATKIGQALGYNPTQAERSQEQATYAANPKTGLAGSLVGGALTGEIVGPAGSLAEAAGQAALLQPAYKLGETAAAAAQEHRPIDAEMIEHAFSFKDMLVAAGLGAAFHGVGTAGSKALDIAQTAGARAEQAAGELVPKAAEALRQTPARVGARALAEDLFSQADKATKLKEAAGQRMSRAAAQGQLDSTFFSALLPKFDPIRQAAKVNVEAEKALQSLAPYAKKFREAESGKLQYSGEEFQTLIGDLRQKAREEGNHNAAGAINDVATVMRNHLADHLDQQAPGLKDAYLDAVSDYRFYESIEKEAAAGSEKVLKLGDVAKLGAKAAVAPAVGGMLGGAPGAMAGLAADIAGAQGAAQTFRKNPALLWKSVAKISPSQLARKRIEAVTSTLMSGTKHALLSEMSLGLDDKSLDENYDHIVQGAQAQMADPAKFASGIGEHLHTIPAPLAAAVSSNLSNKLQSTGVEAPANNAPLTAFGQQVAIPNREKREFLRKVEAKFDPYNAVASGRQDLIQEAERYNPETVNAIKAEVLRRMQTDPNMPYSTKRRLAGILGIAGVPTQDPALAGHLQQILATKRTARTAAGQAGSARQMNATLKNNSATLTRAQRLLNSGDK